VPREVFLDTMTFQGGPLLFTELFGPMVGLKENWLAAGATAAELDFSAFRYRAPVRHRIKLLTGMLDPGLTECYEDDRVIRSRDVFGREWEMTKGAATLPLPCSYVVADMDDWLKIKPQFEWSAKRLLPGFREEALAARARGEVIEIGLVGAFHTPRQLMGEEALCLACYDQPDMLHDMLDTIAGTAFRVIEEATRDIPIDVLFISEDIAGNSGSLWGPREIGEFMRPYYTNLWGLAAERGARLFDLDSDGNVETVFDALLDCGVNCFRTMEPAAGMDVVKTRQKYGPRLAFIGGLDKFAVAKGPEAIDRELAYKLPPMLQSGGAMLSLDHRIPADTPLDNYRYYVAKVREYLERSGK
jgi:hypothetical protein